MKLDRHVAKAFPDQKKAEEKKLKKLFQNRVAIVRLRHKETGKVIVFLSFHNIQHGKKLATGFCEIVRMIAEHKKLPVVVGADLNCKAKDFSSAASVYVPKYDLTDRRSSGSKGKIDFFLHSSPSTGVVKITGSVSALDVFPCDDTDNDFRFHLLNMRKRTNRKYSVHEYSASLNHDPLLCKLTVK